MNKEIMKLTQTMEYNSFSSEEAIKSVELEIDMIYPTQYREFMLETNGAEGNIGQNSYLAIWSIEEIVPLNIDES